MIRTRGCSGVLALLAALILAGSARAFSPENTTFKGDLRLRYQYEQTEKTDGLLQRHRGRFRFRVGFATMMSENIEIGARLATGDTDPRSTNQTATSFFSTKDIRLDRAYVYWDASRQLTVKFGKYSESFLVTDDLLWDSDITFEGGTLDWRKQMAGGAAPFVYGAMSVLEENKTTSKDIQMYVVQPGIVYDSDRLGLKTGLTLYVFEHLKGSMPDDDISSGTNTRVDGNLKYDYDSINPVLFLVYRPAGSGASAPVLKVIGNYVYNFDSRDAGYRLGLILGSERIKNAGSWLVHYNYRRLERDAFPDVFPDSDFYGGATDVSGHEVIVQYGIAKNVSAGLDYYNARRIDEEDQPQNLLQVDCVFKF